MAADLLRTLLQATLFSSLALVMVGLLRHALRALVGAQSAYWVWLLVPAMTLAALLPAPSQVLATATRVTAPLQSALSVVAVTDTGSYGNVPVFALLGLWLVGVVVMSGILVRRQQVFLRSLGELRRDPQGLFRSVTASAPVLVGAWRPRVVVPADFESRYSRQECELVLAHERAHERRRDVAINALASFVLCLFWFNPLVYRALAWLRMDQELACDAAVLAERAGARQAYANALLKTQLATESAWRLPIGCHWQSRHPLKERILMLKRSQPGTARRATGAAFLIALAGATGYAAWAGAATHDAGPAILVNLKVTITRTLTNDVRALATQYLVRSGQEITDANARPLDFSCIPYLPDQPGVATDWSAVKKRGIPLPAAGQVLTLCVIRENGVVVQSPAVIAGEGKWATIETGADGGATVYRIEVNATTSAQDIAAAEAASLRSR